MHRFWGKLDVTVAPARIHPLVDLCIDVAFTFRRIVAIPAFRRRLETAAGHPFADQQLERLAVVAMLHDIGKCNPNPSYPSRGFGRLLRARGDRPTAESVALDDLRAALRTRRSTHAGLLQNDAIALGKR